MRLLNYLYLLLFAATVVVADPHYRYRAGLDVTEPGNYALRLPLEARAVVNESHDISLQDASGNGVAIEFEKQRNAVAEYQVRADSLLRIEHSKGKSSAVSNYLAEFSHGDSLQIDRIELHFDYTKQHLPKSVFKDGLTVDLYGLESGQVEFLKIAEDSRLFAIKDPKETPPYSFIKNYISFRTGNYQAFRIVLRGKEIPELLGVSVTGRVENPVKMIESRLVLEEAQISQAQRLWFGVGTAANFYWITSKDGAIPLSGIRFTANQGNYVSRVKLFSVSNDRVIPADLLATNTVFDINKETRTTLYFDEYRSNRFLLLVAQEDGLTKRDNFLPLSATGLITPAIIKFIVPDAPTTPESIVVMPLTVYLDNPSRLTPTLKMVSPSSTEDLQQKTAKFGTIERNPTFTGPQPPGSANRSVIVSWIIMAALLAALACILILWLQYIKSSRKNNIYN